MADASRVRLWLNALGRLTVASMSATEANQILDEVAPMLASRFTDDDFTPASLEHVAAECKYLPTYGEIVALIRAWQEETYPQQITSDADPITAERDAWVRNWQRHADGDWGRSRDGAPYRGDASQLKRDLARVKQFQASAYQHLIAIDPRAKRIATAAGWFKAGEVVPMPAAASRAPTLVQRGPVIDEDTP